MSVKVEMIKRGDVLPNGALVLQVGIDTTQEVFGDMRPQGVVLAMVGGGSWAHEFVTWDYVIDERGVVTVSGHYFDSVVNAVDDFRQRRALQGA